MPCHPDTIEYVDAPDGCADGVKTAPGADRSRCHLDQLMSGLRGR